MVIEKRLAVPADGAQKAQTSDKGARTLIVGVFLALFLKSIDKQLLGLMKPVLDGVFGWSAATYADIAALSQLVGAASLLLAGRIVDRFPVPTTLAVGVLTWSIFTAGQALATSIAAFAALRLLLSCAETIGNPAALRLYSAYLAPDRRPAAVATINLAASSGAIAAPLLVPLVAQGLGWSGVFALAGIAGICWSAWWTMLAPGPLQVHVTTERPPPAAKARYWPASAWAMVGAKALTDQWWWFAIYWLPDFFALTFGGKATSWAMSVAIAYGAAAVGSLAAPRVLRFGNSALVGYVILICCLPLAAKASSLWQATAIVCAGMFAHQVISTRLFLRVCEPRFATVTGSLASTGAFAGHLLAYIALQVIGALRDSPAGYPAILALLAICHGSGAGLLLLSRLKFTRGDS